MIRDFTDYVWDVVNEDFSFFRVHFGTNIQRNGNGDLTKCMIPDKNEVILLRGKKLKVNAVEIINDPGYLIDLGISVGVWCESIN